MTINPINPGDPGAINLQPGDTFGGNGSAGDPFKILNADFFDAAVKAINANTSVHTVFLQPGAYETRGIWNFAEQGYRHFNRSIRLIGANDITPTIRLSPGAVRHTLREGEQWTRPDAAVLGLGAYYANHPGPFTVENIQIDGNEQAFVASQLVTGGILIHANHVAISECWVRGLRGSFDDREHGEAFGILIDNFENGRGDIDGGNRVKNVTVITNGDRQDYVSPIYVACRRYSRPLALSIIEGCDVLNSGAKPTRLCFSCNSATLIRDCSAENVVHGPLYNDTGEMSDVTVEDCSVTGLHYAAGWVTVDATKRNVSVNRCRFEYVDSPISAEQIGLTVWDQGGTGAEASDIVMRDCEFVAPPNRQIILASIKAAGATRIGFERVSIPGNTRAPLIQSPTPNGAWSEMGTRRQEVAK